MRFLMRLFAAFCVATVVAQLLIVGMIAMRGNLHGESLTKAIALFNGIDISGVQLQKALSNARNVPVPTYDEVLAQRAQQNLNLEMRERSIQRFNEQLESMQIQLKQQQADFDRRKEAFYSLLDEMSKKGKAENLGEIQRTLEALSPEQAKALLVRMLEAEQMADVVAIIKGMALDKRKKILGEFTTEKEISQVAEVLNQLRLGEPAASVIDQARSGVAGDSP
jgi:hypothetical protein